MWIVLAVLAAGLVVVVSSSSAGAAVKAVSIEQFMFTPAAVTVAPGDTVKWTNNDTAPHTVTVVSGPAKFASPTLRKGDSFSFTFDKPGTYAYYCAIHPDMKATVTVVAAAAAVTEPPQAHSMPAPVPSPQVDPPPAPAPPAPPAMTAAPETPTPGPAPPGGAPCASSAISNAMLEPFVIHLNKAHLEESPGQQAADLLDVDQYVKTHTVLIQSMSMPLAALVLAAPGGLDPFVAHVNKAHLEESPGQQAADLLDIDQYVKTHTVLVGSMAAPAVASASGTTEC